MPSHYGYIKGTKGKDKDHIDVYLGDNPGGIIVYVVNQVDLEGKFDEHKIMLGFRNKQEAIDIYDRAFSGDLGPKLRKEIVSTTVDKLKHWLAKGDHKKPFKRVVEERAVHLVRHLVEGGEEDDLTDKQIDSYIGQVWQHSMSKYPPEAQQILQYAPHDFRVALFQGKADTWEPGGYDMSESWPSYDSDSEDNPWSSYTYFSEYEADNGKLFQNVHEVDSDGNREFVEAAAVGTPEWREMMEQFSYYKWQEAVAEYYAWVAEHGDDPLDYLYIRLHQPRRPPQVLEGPRDQIDPAVTPSHDGLPIPPQRRSAVHKRRRSRVQSGCAHMAGNAGAGRRRSRGGTQAGAAWH
jgi:hypothetical protein